MTRSAKGDEKRDEVVESALYKLSFSLSKYSKSNAEALFPKDESQHIDLTLTVNFSYSFIFSSKKLWAGYSAESVERLKEI